MRRPSTTTSSAPRPTSPPSGSSGCCRRPSGSPCRPRTCPAPTCSTPSSARPTARRSAIASSALAARRGLQDVRWPDPFPSDTAYAMRAATYACQIGRAVAFSLAAFRQAFAGGRDLGVPDNVLIAAAACEMHPRAVSRAPAGVGRRALDEATALAAQRGVRDVPAVWLPDGRVFHGDDGARRRGARADRVASNGHARQPQLLASLHNPLRRSPRAWTRRASTPSRGRSRSASGEAAMRPSPRTCATAARARTSRPAAACSSGTCPTPDAGAVRAGGCARTSRGLDEETFGSRAAGERRRSARKFATWRSAWSGRRRAPRVARARRRTRGSTGRPSPRAARRFLAAAYTVTESRCSTSAYVGSPARSAVRPASGLTGARDDEHPELRATGVTSHELGVASPRGRQGIEHLRPARSRRARQRGSGMCRHRGRPSRPPLREDLRPRSTSSATVVRHRPRRRSTRSTGRTSSRAYCFGR